MGNLVFPPDTSINQINIPEMKTDLKKGMRRQDINLTMDIDIVYQLKGKIKTIAFLSYQHGMLDNILAGRWASRSIEMATNLGFQYSLSDK
jgi:hypothetical protein